MEKHSGHVLLVDDDRLFQAFIRDTLEGRGFKVTSVLDGLEAITLAESEPPDLILLDIVLPKMNGLDILQIFKQSPVTSEIPVLLVTAEKGEEILVRGLRLGAEDVLFKPLSPVELGLRLELSIKRKRRLEKLLETIRHHVDPKIANELIDQPVGCPQLRREFVTVLFSDLRGLTRLTRALPPVQASHLLNGLVDELVRCVQRFNGMLDKFLGEGLTAFFGVSGAQSDNELRAVRAAAEMIQAFQKFEHLLRAGPIEPVDLGIGIASGDILLGQVGNRVNPRLTAIGTPINEAARLSNLAKGREIIISLSVRQSLPPEILAEQRPPGRENPAEDTTAFTVLFPLPSPVSPPPGANNG